jgi:hypothetical protein
MLSVAFFDVLGLFIIVKKIYACQIAKFKLSEFIFHE